MKKLICLIIALLMVFAFAGCYFSDSINLQKQIDDLQKKIEEQAEKNTKLENENSHLAERISELEKELDELKNAEMAEILKQFDLTDPKILWKGSVDDNFADDLVILVLRKTTYYHELELRHFKLENAESLEYIGSARPADFYFEEGNEEMLALFRQTVFIKLKECRKEKVVEAIRHLEKLDFVRYAGPNRYLELD